MLLLLLFSPPAMLCAYLILSATHMWMSWQLFSILVSSDGIPNVWSLSREVISDNPLIFYSFIPVSIATTLLHMVLIDGVGGEFWRFMSAVIAVSFFLSLALITVMFAIGFIMTLYWIRVPAGMIVAAGIAIAWIPILLLSHSDY